MSRCSPKCTINLAVESIDALKKKASKLKNLDATTKHKDPCVQKLAVVPAPLRKIGEKQIQICKCPATEFICPPIPCTCPPCPVCTTTEERLVSIVKAALKLVVLYAMLRWTLEQEIWGKSDYTSRLTNYYSTLINALRYGEDKSIIMSEKLPPGFVEIKQIVYESQVMWNKFIHGIFYITIGLPLSFAYKVADSVKSMVAVEEVSYNYDDNDDMDDEDEEP